MSELNAVSDSQSVERDAKGAIERLLVKRILRGASDESIVTRLNSLKNTWQTTGMVFFLDTLIAGVEDAEKNQRFRLAVKSIAAATSGNHHDD
jgi:hypothetical protein